MTRQNELTIIKALSTLQMNLATARRKKVPTVYAETRSTTSGSGKRASQQLTGKRKDNELARSCDSTEPANWRPSTCDWSVTLPATTIITGKQAAASSGNPKYPG